MEDKIKEIGIDGEGRLYLKPAVETFPMIYREAMEVHWSSEHGYLYGGVPRKWSYLDWYHQILKAASEQGCKLVASSDVTWVNIPAELQAQIVGEQGA
ncbi:hypothetical protein [Microbulbifer sp.]|uniref:hypothetical protein n=1 Tax=Microbulbifer sp. TaxID=1908541 RepID=UPI0025837EE3|nr:hypothetical protein [Microbulbifer sp.]